MSLSYVLYNLLASLAAPVGVGAAALKGRLRGHWRERLGFFPGPVRTGSPRIWVHAVSVGEMQAAAALVEALLNRAPGASVLVSSTTDQGREEAGRQLPPEAAVCTFPLDVYGAPARALDRFQPDLLIILETELWPNFLREARRRGIRTMLANGRISVRSFVRYRRFRFLFEEVLGCVDLMCMIRPEDRERIISMGAAPDRVVVAGNAKFDRLLRRADPDRVAELGREIGLGTGRPVLAAGSTREGEEDLVLEAFLGIRRDFPDLHLILAPRHVTRAGEVEALVRRLGLSLVRRSRSEKGGGRPDVTLVDVMGELFYLYGLADVAFCGGSLVRLGGQNPLEPATWGVPVLYGPSMEDFTDAVEMLESVGAGRKVDGAAGLARAAGEILADPEEAARLGEAGRMALQNHAGAADRLAEAALKLLA
ncbi:MAG: 3-deoxy-D-manno-octulosonic acid transferase [Thermodesulfobacteriota bacterium]